MDSSPQPASVYASSYQSELLEVFPNRYSVILEGSKCQSESCRFFSTSSNTDFPPAWMQKCSNASLKSGMYGLIFFIFNSFLARNVAKKSNCSDMGSTRGAKVVMLVLRASPATAMRSFERETPISPSPSSLWYTQE
nr:hypothetical protein Ccrd_025451 [Ipomoea batatas]GMD92198.1 hypothetical protein Ccrd_025451 [Ipomoea batatas]GME15807.1 hypothetical protein Ccrd_025451 [Ipomoea batatas]